MATLHERFKALREALNWSWADVDRITGRKNSRTNITKRVPAWAHLAIEAHETYEARLQLHVIDAINQRLGDEWPLKQTSSGGILFQRDSDPDASIELTFAPGTFTLSSKSPRLEGLLEQLAALYPYSVQESASKFKFSMLDQQNQKKTMVQMTEEREVIF
jgi:hypothetical protein